MVRTTVAYALAARAHGRDGRLLMTRDTLDRMRAAAVAFGEAGRDMLAGPSSLVDESTLVIQLATPAAVLPASRTIAASVRPARTTFCAARSAIDSSTAAGDSVEPAILAADRAASEAAARLADAEFRSERFIVTAPPPGELIGALLGLIIEAYDSMTDRQRQIVELVRASDTQQEVATHLGVSRQAVNQSLIAAGWPHIERAEEIVQRELAALWAGGSPNGRS